jgi:hypothetical protein
MKRRELGGLISGIALIVLAVTITVLSYFSAQSSK